MLYICGYITISLNSEKGTPQAIAESQNHRSYRDGWVAEEAKKEDEMKTVKLFLVVMAAALVTFGLGTMAYAFH